MYRLEYQKYVVPPEGKTFRHPRFEKETSVLEFEDRNKAIQTFVDMFYAIEDGKNIIGDPLEIKEEKTGLVVFSKDLIGD